MQAASLGASFFGYSKYTRAVTFQNLRHTHTHTYIHKIMHTQGNLNMGIPNMGNPNMGNPAMNAFSDSVQGLGDVVKNSEKSTLW